MLSTSFEVPDWMKHKLESRLQREISYFRYADDTTLMAESKEELQRLVIKVNSSTLSFLYRPLSHPHMTTGKPIALTRWTFVGKVMSPFFNMLSRLVITFLLRSKHINFMAAVTICSDFGGQENKVCHCFHCFPIYLHEVVRMDVMILVF